MTQPSQAAGLPDSAMPWMTSGVRVRISGLEPMLQILDAKNVVVAYVPYSDRTPRAHAESHRDQRLIVQSVNRAPQFDALVMALEAVIAADQREKFTTIECDAAGNTQQIDIVDGPCATIARTALSNLRAST